MEKPGKAVMISVFAVASFTTLFIFYFVLIPGGSAETPQDTHITNLTLSIDYKNGTVDNFTDFSLDEGLTSVFHAVYKNCDIIYKIYANGDYYISNINGIDIGWIYYVNDEFHQIPVDKYHLSDGDTIKFVHV